MKVRCIAFAKVARTKKDQIVSLGAVAKLFGQSPYHYLTHPEAFDYDFLVAQYVWEAEAKELEKMKK